MQAFNILLSEVHWMRVLFLAFGASSFILFLTAVL